MDSHKFLVHVVDGGTGRYNIGIANTRDDALELAVKMILDVSNREEDRIKTLQKERQFKKAIKLAEKEDFAIDIYSIRKASRDNCIVIKYY